MQSIAEWPEEVGLGELLNTLPRAALISPSSAICLTRT
jgi:hypothetical protein